MISFKIGSPMIWRFAFNLSLLNQSRASTRVNEATSAMFSPFSLIASVSFLKRAPLHSVQTFVPSARAPKPSHVGQAPYWLLKLNVLGSISIRLIPHCMQLYRVEKTLLDSTESAAFSTVQTSTKPLDNRTAVSIDSLIRSRFSSLRIMRSTTAEMLCSFRMANVGISSIS